MRFILIGNYPPDGQESMERFAQLLHTGLREAGVAAEIWRPVPVVGGHVGSTVAGLGKWLGYVDKWLLFPVVLRWRVWRRGLHGAEVRFHVCDHSNAPYLGSLPPSQAGITCHDVLAIRGSRGHADAYAPASRFGKVLQQWIFGHLRRAERLATVSELTMRQLLALAGPAPVARPASWCVIPNAFNAYFRPLAVAERAAVLHRAGLALPPSFLLHVGSGAVRKNRACCWKWCTRWASAGRVASDSPARLPTRTCWRGRGRWACTSGLLPWLSPATKRWWRFTARARRSCFRLFPKALAGRSSRPRPAGPRSLPATSSPCRR